MLSRFKQDGEGDFNVQFHFDGPLKKSVRKQLMMIFLSYVKMHFFYVKLNILRKWSNILLKFFVTIFTPEHSLLRRSIPSDHLAHLARHPTGRHPTRPATRPGPPPDLNRHPTQPATPPGPPPHPACLPSRAVFPASSATTASQALRRACAVLVLLQKAVCAWCKSTWGRQPPPIFYKLHLIFYIPHLKFYLPPPKFYLPPPKFYLPPPIFYINLTCHAVNTLSARPLPPGVGNCEVEPPLLVKTRKGTWNV